MTARTSRARVDADTVAGTKHGRKRALQRVGDAEMHLRAVAGEVQEHHGVAQAFVLGLADQSGTADVERQGDSSSKPEATGAVR